VNPVSFYKCLADEIRLKCLLLIAREDELCVCELQAALDESQPKISRHLAQLRKCGLLQDTRRGQWVHYSLHPDLPAWSRQVLQTTLASSDDFMQDAYTKLSSMGDRPERAAACC
jgi:ArsR family transcriptional regulator